MNSSAAEIDLKLRDDFRRYLREYGIESTLIDPVLAVLFRTLASQIYALSSDTDRLRTALLDELLEGLGFERRFAHPAQLVVRYGCQADSAYVSAGTVLSGEPEGGGRMSFATDYGISVSSARIAATFVYQCPLEGGRPGAGPGGELRLLSGIELPAENLRAGPSYGPVPAELGPHPAIYIAIENLGPTHLSRHGIFLQTSPEATLLAMQLESENWCLSSNNGRFESAGVLRPHSLNAGQRQLQWLKPADEAVAAPGGAEMPSLPGGFWRGKCFVLPSMPAQRHFLCDIPHGLEAPLRSIFERPGLFLRPRAWLRIQLDVRVEALHSAISAVYLHAQSASNVECSNQTVRFTENGTTIPVSRETGGRSFLVAPLSIAGESGKTYLPEFQPSFSPGVGRYRLHQGYLTLIPGKMPDGADEGYANVRLWMTTGASGNQMGVARLQSFAKEPPVRGLSVENITAAAGGSDGEGLHSARRRFSEALLSRQRLLTRIDLEVSIRSFDHRITRIDVHPILARSARGLRRLHRITVMARRDRFTAPEEEARTLVNDLHNFLAERVPLDVDVNVELAWT
ncbi:MAG: hypothetical protein JWQ42_2536 [Edaphobacter sp.]|nr:hypothetical protein [Edaphobacter sp.]